MRAKSHFCVQIDILRISVSQIATNIRVTHPASIFYGASLSLLTQEMNMEICQNFPCLIFRGDFSLPDENFLTEENVFVIFFSIAYAIIAEIFSPLLHTSVAFDSFR